MGGRREPGGGPHRDIDVLLVDDDESFVETTARLLELAGEEYRYRCRTTTSGAAALDVLDDGVDCVVSDFDMPGMDGVELLSAIRDRGVDVPFVLFTGHGNEDIASEAIDAGASDYVPKHGRSDVTVLKNRIEGIVARHRAEAERDLRARAMEAVGEGIAVIDDDGRFVDVNRAYQELYGYDRDELVGAPWSLVNPPHENERMRLQILPAVEREGKWVGESVGLRADGSTFPKEKSFTRLDGGGFVCAVSDVTERKEQEHALREQNERLREFARLVSHDLRNPLNVAEGYLSLLDDDGDADSDHVDRIRSAHQRMRRLIEDMLDLARGGRVVDDPDPLSLADVVEDAAMTSGLETAGTLVVGDLPTIVADRGRLETLLENLFGNALAHAGPEPTVRVSALVDGFAVEDDGPGIPEAERVAVFESGYSTGQDGTGFGLAIVDRVATAHGWTVTVRDGIDGGARFEVRGVTVAADTASEEADVEADGGARHPDCHD